MSTTALKAVESQLPNRQDAGAIMEAVIAKGDLAQLKPEERARYYLETCRSLGINPLVKPFEYITLNGKLTLYATRTATDQLRSTRNVSIEIIGREPIGDIYVVTARASMPGANYSLGTPRKDESTGAVNIKGFQGDALANAYMKAETKAKRRVTLSICGLGWMDETETATVPGAQIVPVDTETGEIMDVAAFNAEQEYQESIAVPEQTEENASPIAEANKPKGLHGEPLGTVKQMKDLHFEASQRGLDHEDVHALAGLKGFESITQMTGDQLKTMGAWLQSVKPAELDMWLTKCGRPTMDARLEITNG